MTSRYGTKRSSSSLPTLGERAAMAQGAISIEITYSYKKLWGFLQPSTEQIQPGFPANFEVTFWGDSFGKVFYSDGWLCSVPRDQLIVDKIGVFIFAWYE